MVVCLVGSVGARRRDCVICLVGLVGAERQDCVLCLFSRNRKVKLSILLCSQGFGEQSRVSTCKACGKQVK